MSGWNPYARVRAIVLIACVCFGPGTMGLPAANGDLVSVTVLPAGVEVIDLTQDTRDGSFWILGANGSSVGNHSIYHIDRDFTEILGSVENPHPTGAIESNDLTTHRGIAYRPLTSSLLVLSSIGPRLTQELWVREIHTDGTPVLDNQNRAKAFRLLLDDDSSSLFGLTYDLVDRRFWSHDVEGERLVQFGDGTLDSDSSVSDQLLIPGRDDPAIRFSGAGVGFALQSEGARLYVAFGDVFSPGASKVLELGTEGVVDGGGAPLGVLTGFEIPVNSTGDNDLRGFHLFTGALAQPRLAIVGSNGRVYLIDRTPSDPLPPTGLTCSLTPDNEVHLSWVNHGGGIDGGYNGRLQVLRNGVPVATVDGLMTSYVDETPVEGTALYAVRGSEASGGPFSDSSCDCRVTVGAGGLIDWAPFPGGHMHDVTEDLTTGDVYVTDRLGDQIYRYDADLQLIDSFASPIPNPGGIAFVPSITLGFPPQAFQNMLAIGEAAGSRVRIVPASDPTAPAVTTLTLRLDGVDSPSISGLTYNDPTQEFVVIDQSTFPPQSFRLRSDGETNGQCSNFQYVYSNGISLDPASDSYLAVFDDGFIREIFVQGNCTASGFQFELSTFGPSFTEPGFFGGIQVSGNSVLVTAPSIDVIGRVLQNPDQRVFIRGDANRDDAVNLPDAQFLAAALFLGEGPITCLDAADANDDEEVGVADVVQILFALFVPGSAPIEMPYPEPGTDPTFRGPLGCAE